ncbi:hypothetical protein SCHPADRAFT_902529 [Schizopora paradoxa]|uniref:Zn(2)-C6 fungal-type domain-containing protein n=1 Tax=Schizopora paradoxa TaxID=27342 RepID=A0A0H2S0F0_9AGAM|nr:hypothetical protein SCHPADRAFT_902529 [Schizopora paradoxa]
MSSKPENATQEFADEEGEQFVRTPRRTPMACLFCRGRKLKCDGRSICANCLRRSISCVYEPVGKS